MLMIQIAGGILLALVVIAFWPLVWRLATVSAALAFGIMVWLVIKPEPKFEPVVTQIRPNLQCPTNRFAVFGSSYMYTDAEIDECWRRRKDHER